MCDIGSQSLNAHETDKAVPLRGRLRRILLYFIAAPAALLICLWLLWAALAQYRLGSKLESLRQAEDYLDPNAFAASSISDRENAAVSLRRAEQLAHLIGIPLTGELLTWLKKGPRADQGSSPDVQVVIKTWFPVHEELIASNSEALALAAESLSRSAVDWKYDITSVTNRRNDRLSAKQLLISKLLCCKAISQFHQEDHCAMFRTLQNAVSITELQARHPAMNASAISHEGQHSVLYMIEHIGPSLFLPRADSRRGKSCELQDVQGAARALIAKLVNEENFVSSFERTLQVRRARSLFIGEEVIAGRLSRQSLAAGAKPTAPSALGRVLVLLQRPVLQLDLERLMSYWSAAVLGAGQPNWPKAYAALPSEPDWRWPTPFVDLSPLSRRLAKPVVYETEAHFGALAHRRLIATALAMWCYHAKNGIFPNSLEALVPDYLPAVPEDPFAEHGRRISLELKDRPRLFSVWLNQTDDGGVLVLDRNGRVDPENGDRVVYLTNSLK